MASWTVTRYQCVIRGQAFFVRGLIEIPVTDTGEIFSWGEAEPPYFGWLSTRLPVYSPTTVNLKTNVRTRPVGERPAVEMEPTAHPLALEQRTGITRARVQQIAETLLHPGRTPQ